MFKLLYTAEARSQIHKLSAALQLQLKESIERIAADPSVGKRLTQELSGYWSYRSGDYRVIYSIFHKEVTVLIVTLGHRKNIYTKLARKLN